MSLKLTPPFSLHREFCLAQQPARFVEEGVLNGVGENDDHRDEGSLGISMFMGSASM